MSIVFCKVRHNFKAEAHAWVPVIRTRTKLLADGERVLDGGEPQWSTPGWPDKPSPGSLLIGLKINVKTVEYHCNNGSLSES